MRAALSNTPGRDARSLLLAMLVALAALLLLAWPGRAQAQVTVGKTLCDASVPACSPSASLSSVSLGQAVYYEVTINNTGTGAAAIDLQETFPPGFQLSGVVCTNQGNNSVQPTAPLVANLAPGIWVCRFSGSYGAGSLTGANNVVEVFRAGTQTSLATNSHNTAINLAGPLPSDLRITKTADLASIDVSATPQIVTYTITLENLGANDLVLGTLLEIQDRLYLKPQSVALNAQFVGATCVVVPSTANSGITPASDCLDPVPSQPANANPLLIGYTAPHDFASWHYPAGSNGLLKVGDKVVLTVQVKVSRLPSLNCIIAPGGDGFFQGAHIVLTLPAVGSGPITTLADLVPGNNSAEVPLDVITGATQVDPACNAPFQPKVKILKTQLLPPSMAIVPWGAPFVIYRLEVQNLSTTHRIKNIQLRDLVEEGVGTPPFTATFLTHNCPAAVCTNASAMPPQQLPGYGITQQVFSALLYGGSSTGMAPASSATSPTTVSFLVRIRYSNPRCDSIRDGAVDPVRNHLRVLSWDEVDTSNSTTTSVNLVLDHAVTTRMQEAPACPLLVTKTPAVTGPFAPAQIQFNVPYDYTVTYENPTPQTFTVGTLIDTLRFSPSPPTASPYAISLKVDYSYQCTPFGPMSGHPTANPNGPGNDIAYIVANALPQQGVRLIQNAGPVTFGPNAKLVCAVRVTVSPPASSDPYCSTAALDNSAILDMSAYYNPNLPWPTTATLGMWASVSKPLPVCFNWIVNKTASPGWTWQGGGPLSWTYSVYNAGPPMLAGGPLIHDQFSPPAVAAALSVASFTVGCTNPLNNPVPCTSSWLITNPVTTNPGAASVLVPFTLGHQHTLRTTLNVNNAPPSVGPGGLICNNVSASLPNLGGNSYWKNPNTLAAAACVKILATGSIKVTKVVTNNSGLTIPLGYQYQLTLSCTYPPDPTGVVIPSTSLSLVAGASATVPHIPVGSQCSVAEVPPPVPAASATCAFPVWQTYTTPLSPFITPPQANATVAVQVINNLVCRPVAALIIKKTTLPPPVPVPPPLSFLFNVSCAPLGPNTTVSVPANGQILIPNVPIVSICTIAEQIPPPPVPGCTWTATPNPIPPFTVAMPGTTTTVNVVNKLVCTGRLVIRKTTVTPPNMPPPASFLFNVNCTPGGPNTTVSVPANGLSPVLTVSAPGTCTIVEQVPPPPPGCAWSVSQVPPGSVAIAPGASVVVNVTNNLVCGPPGTLVIKKTTIHPVPQSPFTFAVSCTPNGPNTTVTIASNGSGTVGNIPAPAVCTIVEQPHTAPPGCTWVGTQAPPGPISVAPGATVTVTFTNNLVCNPSGTLIIKKTTIHPAAQTPFTFAVNCTPNGPSTTVTVPFNGSGTIGNIPAPAVCTIVEQPHTAPPGCTWVGTQAPPGPVTIAPGATVTVAYTNNLVCGPAGASLQIVKTTNFPPGAPQFASVAVNVSCTPGGPNTTVTVPANGQIVVPNIPVPATCTVTEQVPPSNLAGCAWTVTKVPAGTNGLASAGATGTATLTNNWVCNPFGTLFINLRTAFRPGARQFASVPFDVSCRPWGPNVTVAVPANGRSAGIDVRAPSECTVTQQVPSAPRGCVWTPIPGAVDTATINADTRTTLNIADELNCGR